MFVSVYSVAWSQESLAADARADSKEDSKYHDSLKDALAEYDAHHFEEARILFRRAHDLNPNARTLRSIGMASFELRDYVAAVRALSAALVDTRKPLNPEQRAHAQGLLERSRMFVDVYTLKISPADTRVLLDGRAPEYEPDGTLFLGFGSHNLEVRKPGFAIRTMTVNVRGGERKELAMTLEKKPSEQSQTAKVAPSDLSEASRTTARDVTPPRPGWHPGSAWFLAAGGTSLAALGGGVWWLLRSKELDKCNNPPPGYAVCGERSTIQTQRNLLLGATAVAGAAAVTMAVVGIVSWNSPPRASAQNSVVACSVYPAGLLCGTSF